MKPPPRGAVTGMDRNEVNALPRRCCIPAGPYSTFPAGMKFDGGQAITIGVGAMPLNGDAVTLV